MPVRTGYVEDVNGACSDCAPGYASTGTDICVDIDECSDANVCGVNELCVNLAGSFQCGCLPGYSLNNEGLCLACATGYAPTGIGSCVDVDECAAASICGSNATCENTPGAFTCSCNEGSHKTTMALALTKTNVWTITEIVAQIASVKTLKFQVMMRTAVLVKQVTLITVQVLEIAVPVRQDFIVTMVFVRRRNKRMKRATEMPSVPSQACNQNGVCD